MELRKFVYDSRFEEPGFGDIVYENIPQDILSYRFNFSRFSDLGLDECEVLKRPRIDKKTEELLFLQYNYARWMKETGRANGELGVLEAVILRDENAIINTNFPLVPAMIKAYGIGSLSLHEAFSSGNFSLLKATRRFEVSRGFRFSTYACNSIMRNLSREKKENTNRYLRYPASDSEPDDLYDPKTRKERDSRDNILSVREVIDRNLACLSERELLCLRLKVLDGNKRTFRDVGEFIGLSGQATKNIFDKALKHLARYMDEEDEIIV